MAIQELCLAVATLRFKEAFDNAKAENAKARATGPETVGPLEEYMMNICGNLEELHRYKSFVRGTRMSRQTF